MKLWKQCLVMALVSLASAAVGGLLVGLWIQRSFEARVRMHEQTFLVKLADPTITVVADLVNPVNVALDTRVAADVPVNQHFQIPLDQTITAEATIDHAVPIKTVVHIKQDVPIDTRLHLDTVVTLPVLHSTVDVPVNAWIPIKTKIPLDVMVPIDQSVPMSFTVPVSAKIHQTFDVPLRVKVAADVPIKTTVQIPLLSGLQARVHMPKEPLSAVMLPTEVAVPLTDVDLRPLSPAQAPKN